MKSLMLLMQEVLEDLGTWCCTSTTRDYNTVARRVEDEGWSFLTITLANFGTDFRKSLSQGYVGHDQFLSFSKAGGLPRFLGGFLDRVFDRNTGRLLEKPSTTAIWAVCQFTLMWAKIKVPCSDARNRRALNDYLQCEVDLKASDRSSSSDLLLDFARISCFLWADVLSRADQLVYSGDVIPAHGPGATADALLGNEKWDMRQWTERLDRAFSVEDVLIPNHRYHDLLDQFEIREPGAEMPVKVILVPKTLKTPRVIAKEPTVMMFMQQALALTLTECVERNDFARRTIGWQSQQPNRQLAREGSSSGRLATLDLSEASDRVSNQHVRALLSRFPHLRGAVEAARSRRADVLGFGVDESIRLSKFASMGSALTFPLESMVFATIVFLGVEQTLNRPLTRKDVKSLEGRVRVYGDDIIVPVEFVPAVTRLLQAFGLKVNRDKSFWTGKFRESCGGEYYDGEDVSIVRVRRPLPVNRRDVSEIVSLVETRNQFYLAGMWRSARHLDSILERLKLPFPIVEPSSQGLGRRSHLGYQSQRSCPDLHRPLVKAMVVQSTVPVNSLDGVGALLKCLSRTASTSYLLGVEDREHDELPTVDDEHLKRSGRPRRVDIKSRWIVPF